AVPYVLNQHTSLTAWGGSPKWPHSPEGAILPIGGAVAQLGERLVRNEEVRGSTPLGSTKSRPNARTCGISGGKRHPASQCGPHRWYTLEHAGRVKTSRALQTWRYLLLPTTRSARSR